MWICNRCQVENRDSSSTCENCGAVRPAGRFGSAPAHGEQAPRAPRVSAAQPAAAPVRPTARETYRPPETDMKPRKNRRPLLGLARCVGTALLILLPLLTGLLAWRQYDLLSQTLLPLLLGSEGADWLKLGCYVLLGFIAVLLASLPGLWTLLFSARPKAPKKEGDRGRP